MNKGAKRKYLLIIPALLFVFTACQKDDDFKPEALENYAPLAVGKRFIYKLDSTVKSANSDTEFVTRSYQAKDTVTVSFKDSQNRNAFTVVRYLRGVNSTDEGAWQPIATYTVAVGRNVVEIIDFSNLRYQALLLPIQQYDTWKGNSALPFSPFDGLFNFTIDDYMNEWEFSYDGVDEPVTLNNTTYDSVVTVLQVDESINIPIHVDAFSSRSYSVERYAKGVGLIYKEFELWEFQPRDQGSHPYGFRQGFGIKLQLIDHN